MTVHGWCQTSCTPGGAKLIWYYPWTIKVDVYLVAVYVRAEWTKLSRAPSTFMPIVYQQLIPCLLTVFLFSCSLVRQFVLFSKSYCFGGGNVYDPGNVYVPGNVYGSSIRVPAVLHHLALRKRKRKKKLEQRLVFSEQDFSSRNFSLSRLMGLKRLTSVRESS